MNDSMPAS